MSTTFANVWKKMDDHGFALPTDREMIRVLCDRVVREELSAKDELTALLQTEIASLEKRLAEKDKIIKEAMNRNDCQSVPSDEDADTHVRKNYVPHRGYAYRRLR